MPKPYTIRVSSQKGGVGKTTIAVNFASSLKSFGYNVLLLDTDFTNPSVGFHLGLEDVNIGIQSVMLHKVKLQNAVVTHDTTGLEVLPCEVNSKMPIYSGSQLRDLKSEISRESYSFVVIDTPPGFLPKGLEDIYDEALIITTPDLPAFASVLRLAANYDKIHLRHSLIVNRLKHKGYEVNMREMEDTYGRSAEATLPESEVVPKSISAHIPAVVCNPKDPFSRAVVQLVDRYRYRIEGQPAGKPVNGRGIISTFIGRFSNR